MNKPRSYIAGFVFTLVFAAGFCGISRADVMTLEQALKMAVEFSPDIKMAGEQQLQSEIAIDEAVASYYPQIDVFAETGREYNNPANSAGSTIATGGGSSNPSSEVSLTINQFIFDGFQTQEEVKRRGTLVDSAAYQKLQVEERILIETIEAYTSLLRSQRSIIDAKEFVKVMEEIERKLILMVEAGAENEAKLKFVQARVAAAQQDKIRIESSLSDATTELELLIGKQQNGIEVTHPSGNFILIEELEKYFDYAQQRNKEIQVNKSDKKALEHQLESLYGSEYPRINALIEVSQNHDVGGEVGKDQNASAMLQLNYNIFDGFAADSGRKRVRSQIREIDHRIEDITRDINQRLKQLYNQLESLKAEWFIIEQEIAANEDVRRLNQEQFELGEADILELVESEERYFNSQVKKHQVEFDFTQTIHQIKQEAGLLRLKEFFSDYDDLRDLTIAEAQEEEQLPQDE